MNNTHLGLVSFFKNPLALVALSVFEEIEIWVRCSTKACQFLCRALTPLFLCSIYLVPPTLGGLNISTLKAFPASCKPFHIFAEL